MSMESPTDSAPGFFKPTSWILLALLLVPVLAQVWLQSDLPRFGDFHDDSIYFVTAKSLASGSGYRIESLPGGPAQTKYPPLYPLLLSLAWKWDPEFPRNLHAAAWISWLAFPAVLVQLPALFRRWGFSTGRTWLLLTLFAVNPYVALFSTQLLSEMLFLALLIAAILLVERCLDPGATPFVAFAAGIAGGLVCLTRSAGIVLLGAAVIYLWTRRQRGAAIRCAAGMLPFAAGWMLWSRLNHVVTNDPSLVYYTDYFRNEMYTLSFPDLHLYIWKNVDALLWGLGGLIVPKVTGSWLLKILAEVIAVAMISGVVRMVRRGYGLLYALYAVLGSGLLIICSFPANERLVLPWFPLALAGLLVEAEHFWTTLRACLRHKDRSQRAVAAVFASLSAAVFLGAIGLQFYVGWIFMPEDAQQHRARNAIRGRAYEWARANLPPDSALLSSDDVLFYLYTGRRAMSPILPTQLWYREDRDGIVHWFTDLQPFAQEHGLQYFEFAGADPGLGIDEAAAADIERKIRNHPDLTPLYATEAASLYRLRLQN